MELNLNDFQKINSNSKLTVQRSAVFKLLEQILHDNAVFFANIPNGNSAKKLDDLCREILLYLPFIQELVQRLYELAPKYDFDSKTPGNGYRSLICVCDMIVLQLLSLMRGCTEYRQTVMFRSTYYCKELESFNAMLKFLIVSLQKILLAAKQVPNGSLFPPLDDDYKKYQALLVGMEVADSSCFYGRALGFQFPPSVARIFRFIGVILAAYSLSWEKGVGPFGSLINSGRFFISPEQRASRIIKIIREADIDFCRAFWNLSEFGIQVPKFFCPNMAVNEVRDISCVGPISLDTTEGTVVQIPEPFSHTGQRPVRIRLLSYSYRKEMQSVSRLSPQSYIINYLQPSPYLLFHCHGGGFVATSSKSHETYLRTWAKILNCTIISVDYSLAPENPYPRALEEVLYTYAFVVNNAAQFGWTGEKICLVGDSAGGNLITCLSLKLIELKVKRRPDAIVPIYTPFIFQYLPSPSRLLSFMDPLLHTGIVLRCVAAYTCGKVIDKGNDECNVQQPKAHKSLQDYMNELKKKQSNHIDFEGSSHVISLVNFISDGKSPTVSDRYHHLATGSDENLSDEEEISGESLKSAVQVKSDATKIHLSSTTYDRQLIQFLHSHPLTKNSLTIMNRSGLENSWAQKQNEPTKQAVRSSKLANFLCSSMAVSPLTSPESPEGSEKEVSSSSLVTSLSSHNFTRSMERPQSLKRTISETLANTAALAAGHAFDNFSEWFTKTAHPEDCSKVKLHRCRPLSHEDSDSTSEEASVSDSYMTKLLKVEIPREPLVSPLYAPQRYLKLLPPIWFVACHLDPLLDDTISFACKVRDSGGKVMNIDLLDGLPHGFLNFTLVSPECREGAKICISRIKEAFGISSDKK